MSPVQILIEAKALIINPTSWTQLYLATDSHGEEVTVTNPNATCFCAVGAIGKINGGYCYRNPAEFYLREAAIELFGQGTEAVNDERGHEAVLAVYDRAIEIAEAAE